MSIQDIVLKIKGVGENPRFRTFLGALGVALCAGLAVSAAFFQGRASGAKAAGDRPEIAFVYPPLIDPLMTKCNINIDKSNNGSKNDPGTGTLVKKSGFAGSKTGKTYYPVSCKSLNRVKEENRVYFESQAEAEKAGYAPSKACFK